MTGGVSHGPSGCPQLVTTGDADRWLDAVREIGARSTLGGPYYALVALSSVAAAYGLLAGSLLVVLVAMMLTPPLARCFGLALGLSNRDRDLARRAAMPMVETAVLIIGVGTAVGLIGRRPEFAAEMVDRVGPSLRDTCVALIAGFATAFALVDRRVDPALPGIGVAVVLVPPLAIVGLDLAAGRLAWAGSAVLLFATNLLAVELAAATAFTWLRRRPRMTHDDTYSSARRLTLGPRAEVEPNTALADPTPLPSAVGAGGVASPVPAEHATPRDR